MNYRKARPGKPGEWNGKPMRWRRYERTMKRHNREAVARVADAEIAAAEKFVKWKARGVVARNVIIALALCAAFYLRCTHG